MVHGDGTNLLFRLDDDNLSQLDVDTSWDLGLNNSFILWISGIIKFAGQLNIDIRIGCDANQILGT